MADIIPFGRPAKGDPEAEGWLNGNAICIGCRHKWVQVTRRGDPAVNANESGLECPGCGSFKGMLQRFVCYKDCQQWSCHLCEGSLFSIILAKGDVPCLACASCGNLTNAVDVFNHQARNGE